jgi:hypothetical protein
LTFAELKELGLEIKDFHQLPRALARGQESPKFPALAERFG